MIDSIEEENSEITADPQEEQTPQTSSIVVAVRSKAKQNLIRENLLGRQQPYQYTKEDGLTLNHQSKILLRMISRRKLSIFSDIIRRYSEKKMEQLNSAR